MFSDFNLFRFLKLQFSPDFYYYYLEESWPSERQDEKMTMSSHQEKGKSQTCGHKTIPLAFDAATCL